jgi:mRNA-degrading endonuclease toxin of MazEF toxin-antitoxin module
MAHARGDLHFIEVPQEYRGEHEDFGTHMHVIVSRDDVNNQGKIVIVVPLTSPTSKLSGQQKNIGEYRLSRIRIPEEEKTWDIDAPHKQVGDSLAKTEQLFCITQNHLGKRCGRISAHAMASLETGLCYVLGLPDFKRAARAVSIPGKPLLPPLKT